MDIMTIMGGLAAPAGGDGAATDAAVDGDLAALFAAVLQAAAGDVAVPVDPTPAGADGSPRLQAGQPAETTGDGTEALTTGATPANIAAMLGLGGPSQPPPDGADTPVAVPAPTGGPEPAAGTPQQAAPVATGPGAGQPAPSPGDASPAQPVASPLLTGGDVAKPATGASAQVPDPGTTPAGGGLADANATVDARSASAEPTAAEPTPARPAPQAVASVSAGSGEAPAAPDVAAGRAQAAAAPTPGLDASHVDRVMEAIDSLENAPPPRRIRVEVGDLRVAVSLRHDGIHVTVDGDALPTATWDADLTTALEARGLTLAGSGTQDDEGRHERPTPRHEDPADTPPATRPATPDQGQGDDALRL